MYNAIYILSFLLLFSTGCGGSDTTGQQDHAETEQEIDAVADIPEFSADSAYFYVAQQVSFGPRVPNTPAHKACGEWLQQNMERFADTVYVQTPRIRAYDGTILNLRNIIGSFQPEKRNRILLCAHWDSRPWADHDPDPANHYQPIAGANDGASGVGVLMEIARLLSHSSPQVGVDIIFLDGEDYGKHRFSDAVDLDSWALGSQYWAESPHKIDYNAQFGILLDMVGARNASFSHEGYSMMFAPHIVRKVWGIAHRQGYNSYFINRESGYVIDDHYYINEIRKIPVINIIDQREDTPHGFYEHWHTLKDNMDVIDPLTLKAVGQTVTAVLWLE